MSCFLFIIIGNGLGHITRALAVAKQIVKKKPESKLLVVTTTATKQLVEQFGAEYFYLPAIQELEPPMNANQYNQWMGNTLNEIVVKNTVEGIIFDGAFPYSCIVELLIQCQSQLKIWIKREGDRTSYDQGPLNFYKRFFDQVIIPDEIGLQKHRPYGMKERLVPPIMMLEQQEGESREQVQMEYEIPKESFVWYVQVPEWDPFLHRKLQDYVVRTLLEYESSYLLIAGTRDNTQKEYCKERVRYIKKYPNSLIFRGCDAAITSAGYNTVHELAYFHLPSILVPNLTVVKDDQLERSRRLESLGGVVIYDSTQSLNALIEKVMNQQNKMKEMLEKIEMTNGALVAAELILNQLRERT